MAFKKRNLHETTSYGKYSDRLKSTFSLKKFFILILLIASFTFVVVFGGYMLQTANIFFGVVGKGTVKAISQSLGQAMKKDEFGQINLLLVGYGGDNHQGGYLADTIIVASFNPKKGAVSMISIPRDLYVKKEKGVYGRINMILPYAYSRTKTLSGGVMALAEKATDITGLPISYYAIIDFEGFKNLIDVLGGIDVFVEEPLVDYQYPGSERSYTTFRINSGRNTLDGETALKYARSRHSTSDFSRSQRQQQIIKAVFDKMTANGALKSVSNIKKIYNEYTKMVKTNVSLSEMIRAAQYAFELKHVFTFGLTSECGYDRPSLMKAGCMLYTPNREEFNGMSVLLQNGGTINKLDFYDYTKNFAFFAARNQDFLIEKAQIKIQNGIDPATKKKYGSSRGVANQVAVKMKLFGFDMVNGENAEEK
ncbi:MAG TPA: LCP family protein, partial [Candidatus Absconditabacterales bacterium]|nr:LCP family protein [Candidatus Absconditabacterales bacterium]